MDPAEQIEMSSKVKIIDPQELETMATGLLLSRRSKLLKCEESFEVSDRHGHEEPPDPDESGVIEFKKQPHWSKAYKELKNVLAHREHVPAASESEARRQQQAKKKY